MEYFVGCDLGTSSLKVTLVNSKGRLIRCLSKSYPTYFPHPGFSEQEPADWYSALLEAVKEIATPQEKKDIRGIAIDGQMHGLVALDKNGMPLRRAILWNDSRSIEECRYLNDEVGRNVILDEVGNIAYPGFTGPKILWMRKHEKYLFEKIAMVLLPKDYLVYRLTGVFSTDYSDASGTLWLNAREKNYSEKMIRLFGLRNEQLPPLHQSGEAVGFIKPSLLEELGFSENVFVLSGSGDNAAAAVASGTFGDGKMNISLGTSGTINYSSKRYLFDDQGAIHSFMGAEGCYSLLSCSLTSASCLKWLYEDIFQASDYQAEEKRIDPEKLGHNNVFFLPYLMGERSPINDPMARGVFIGMDLSSKRQDFSLAVMEGVAFALKDSFERMKNLGVSVDYSRLTGGGSRIALWRRILSSVLNIDLLINGEELGPSFGMALLCLVYAGYFSSLGEAKVLVGTETRIRPEPALVEAYRERYEVFRKIYPSIKGVFPDLLV